MINMAEVGKPAEGKAGQKPEAATGEKSDAAGKKKADKKAEKKGKRVRTGKKHFKTDVYKFYKLEGGRAITNKKPCPRCGTGTWLAEHKGRLYCGRCHYTIFDKR